MKPVDRRKAGPGAFELAGEAMHLLRTDAAGALASYYAGSLPFVLALLYFWAEMSRSPYASQHLITSSLGLALLFLWMKLCQAVFTDNLRAKISSSRSRGWDPRWYLRVALIQTAIQPFGVFVLPLSILPVGLLFPWAYAFYQHVTALTDGETAAPLDTFRRAWKQTFLWPAQNIILVVMLLGFGLCVLLNLASVCYLLPNLAKMLLGIESVYTRSGSGMFNTTFQASMFGLAYLCVDPIVKTTFLLRGFYGESLHTGGDLRAELKHLMVSGRTAVVALVLALSLAAPARLDAATNSSPSKTGAPASGIAPAALDRTINQVIHEPRYTWRMPRETIAEDNSTDNIVVRFIKNTVKTVGGWARDSLRWLGDLLDKWLRNLSPHHPGASSGSGFAWITLLQMLLFVLLAVVICVLAVMALRTWQHRRLGPPVIASQAIAPMPDLADENVGADQLPEDAWIKLGRELLARGELRLALRAFYFASLAHLASRNLLAIARFKSNRDYERELHRRSHALPDLLVLFGSNVAVFDRSWYGMHEVDEQMVNHFLANVERIKSI